MYETLKRKLDTYMVELAQKVDPVEFARFFTGIQRSRLDDYNDLFVQEGTIAIRELNKMGISKPIPDGESAITSLVKCSDGRIFGGTSGKRAHFFVYDPSPVADAVVDMGGIEDETMIYKSLVCTETGVIYGGTTTLQLENYPGGYLFKYTPDSDTIAQFKYHLGMVTTVAQPYKGEGIVSLVYDGNHQRVYGLTYPSGILFYFSTKDEKVIKIGAIGKDGAFSRVLALDKASNVYTATERAKIIKYDVHDNELTDTEIYAPCVRGHRYMNAIDSLVLDEQTGLIYGGTLPDGMFFEFDPATSAMRGYGKPTDQSRIRALTIGNEGYVYGMAGAIEGMGHLFRFDKCSKEIHDLGMFMTNVPKYWIGYEFAAMATGNNGEIYVGESDRISHLFIYYPPHKK